MSSPSSTDATPAAAGPAASGAAAAAAAILAKIGTITGPMLLGHLFNWALLGVLSLQVYIYSVSFRGDKLAIRFLVYFLYFLDVLQTVFATHYAWYVLAGGWGNLLVLNITPWTLATIPPLSGLIALLVQGFFSWRIWVLAQTNKRYFLPVLLMIGVTAIGSCIAAWYGGIVSGKIRDISKAYVLDPEVTGWLAGSVACDAMITITLVWQLWHRRNKGFSKINQVVHRAILMTVETGAITTIVVTTELALYLNSSLTSWYFLPGMLSGKLYSNSLLASLNSRSITFHKSNLTSTNGAQVWDIRGSETRGDSIATSVTADIRKNEIELARVHVQQDVIREYEVKPQNFS